VRKSANNIAIQVSNVGKCYQIYDTPRDRLKQFIAPSILRLIGQIPKQYFREFWALKDISLEVKKGESLGIIGRNGCGKSTLLQIIAGTLSPTTGSVCVNGKIAALLELGSGFNPEFTGRENVYMNGAVMGLSQAAITARFNEITAFADIGEFIEQPVKTYSSGMVLRLAFATAINVDPDILIVDEALAVGDLRFQKKCKEKMNEFKERGISLVIVSHVMSDIHTMCDEALFLKNGRIAFIGDAGDTINAYTYEESKNEVARLKEKNIPTLEPRSLPNTYGGDKGGTGEIFIGNVMCYEKAKEETIPEVEFGKNIMIEFDYEAVEKIEWPIFRINFSVLGYKFFANINSTDQGLHIPVIEGKGRVVLEIKHPNLYPQAYMVNIAVVTETINSHLFFWNEAARFLVRAPKSRTMSYPSAIVEFENSISIFEKSDACDLGKH
jgi:ABC-type polysaccharide/polyol phosphate transport system ATPase subunit